jgi:hypothetical protein
MNLSKKDQLLFLKIAQIYEVFRFFKILSITNDEGHSV